MDKIVIKGARENNLKNINIELPKNKLIVLTGVSGSGKSSLAFDTIYAEGQRRYVESLSSYARQFLGGSEKPDVDSIEGLSPSISIDQKTTSKNPRSTVGTVTEIYDYFRLLYARIGRAYCPTHNIEITKQSVEEMVNELLKYEDKTRFIIMAPVINKEVGSHSKLFESLIKQGYIRVRVNNKDYDLSEEIKLDDKKEYTIDVVVDRVVLNENSHSRLHEAIENATILADGKVKVDVVGKEELLFSEKFACPYCDFSIQELEPRLFSFNTPLGACYSCNGLGVKLKLDLDLVIPDDSLSINEGAIVPFNNNIESVDYNKLKNVADHYNIDLDKPFKSLTKKQKDYVLYGTHELIHYKYVTTGNQKIDRKDTYEGIVTNLERRYMETTSEWIRDWLEKYMMEHTCEVCSGARLNEEALSVKINDLNIFEVTNFSIKELIVWFNNIKLTKHEAKIGELLINEIKNRLDFLANVGLTYLTLSRTASTLSGGEAQRIRLATQIGSKLTGVLYVLDEPSIGLHQKDNDKLINAMLSMRDLGNTLIVVEHDTDTMLASDYLVDIGPLAGDKGGYIVSKGTPEEVKNDPNSITGQYLKGTKKIEVPSERKKLGKKFITVKGAKQNNLKDIDVKIPIGVLTCVTGVSGSGKSSLVNEVIARDGMIQVYKHKIKPGNVKSVKGFENIDKIVEISQNPIGRTPRSNPATYTSVFDNIRDLYASTKEAKINGYGKNRFSFNVKGGRCEVCRGEGVKRIEMHFLPDVYIPCEVCKGTRYNRETLLIKYKDNTIADVLNMTVDKAYDFFENIPKIKEKLQVLKDVGLGYIKLGQSAPTLSGGEAARVKLAKELQRKATGKTLFILDEPTTGLHSDDIVRLLAIFKKIVDNNDTVVIIEHNLDVIKTADYIIDLGPEGGDLGGEVVAVGTPEEIAKVKNSYTGQYLKKVL